MPKVNASTECPLSDRQQAHNVMLYGLTWGMIYLAAPVLYIGLTQASLLDQLGYSNTISNLPGAVYLWFSPTAVIMAWLFPYVKLLKPIVAIGYAISAAMAAVVVVALLLPVPHIAMLSVVFHAAVSGVINGTCVAFMWEILGRALSARRRGHAFALSTGPGAFMAVLGSLGSQWLLDQEWTGAAISQFGFRFNYALLYAVVVPLMLVAAWCTARMNVPQPAIETQRQPFVATVFGGFWEFMTNRLILIAVLGYLLVFAGYSIMPTITLYTPTAVGVDSQDLVGYQNALRFGFKAALGIFLGWLLVRSFPKLPLIVTTALCILAVVITMFAPGYWFLLSFGIMGAGELFGLYFPNYVACCSSPEKTRRNMAFCGLILLPCGAMPLVYGAVVDRFKTSLGEQAAFQVSFGIALTILLVALILVVGCLPRRPTITPPPGLIGE